MPSFSVERTPTAAKASLISTANRSAGAIPVPSNAARMALAGCSCSRTSGPATREWETISASGVRPRRSAVAGLTSTTAAAPSVICEALPAVMVPSLLKAGRSLPRDSTVVSGRTPSSRETTVSPRRELMVKGAISAAWNAADSAARRWERAENSSCWARLMPMSVLPSSVEEPMERDSKASVRPSNSRVSSSSMAPYLVPARARCTCGASDMDSCPMATTISASPAAIIRAPATTASVPERHTAFRVSAGTFSPIPAPTADCRAGFWPAPA